MTSSTGADLVVANGGADERDGEDHSAIELLKALLGRTLSNFLYWEFAARTRFRFSEGDEIANLSGSCLHSDLSEATQGG